MKNLLSRLTAGAIVLFAQIVTAFRAIWDGVDPVPVQRVYYANHTSNGDFVLIWAALPLRLRQQTRPVAGSDYWLSSKLKRFIGRDVFNAVLIDRNQNTRQEDPIEQMAQAVREGSSLILFPEGTRNVSEEDLLPFKPGIFHLANSCPDVDFVPVWIENLNHVMPKGEILPLPLLCTVRFGAALRRHEGEEKAQFLERSRAALLALKDQEAPS
ncbi:1-acyl-sn-glycerol-3-phosphate acyltransferase [Shimia sp. R11_0]|uniref:lysophospholipid acyltransferase family protein n=1 Tax=Shimia sp. R11_0 TaxID=2821096 RepID=UPI001AD99A29|nr:lysophospholipid acyltransferase family protein [Shimia sp. R11_0]MBO9476051.1 1-acyl-sn-glycerol-3-phosphate acyltransferase [Shimia sp. R11_0]